MGLFLTCALLLLAPGNLSGLLRERALYPFYGSIIGSSFSVLGALYVMGWNLHTQGRRELDAIAHAAEQIKSAAGDKGRYQEYYILDPDYFPNSKFDVHRAVWSGSIQLIINSASLLPSWEVAKSIRSFPAAQAYYVLHTQIGGFLPELYAAQKAVLGSSNIKEIYDILDGLSPVLGEIEFLSEQLRLAARKPRLEDMILPPYSGAKLHPYSYRGAYGRAYGVGTRLSRHDGDI
jgi:hypothetical protein